ncbi:MAG: cyclase family protein [Acidobacteria bacterium]|nr:MAG: cyclase family protein [Acidobacteriota bacterium]REK02804.1 MAG: cyclase family protein [Acidobacteriota bacterium]REK13392.1 MAG: cyclase family protein [Acidobacteriota bacterium]REK41386.1 MAG: cyclase family protein [Acidobacteriota bacterium]
MKIFDVSVPISSTTPVYEGDPQVDVSIKMSLEKGDIANVSGICLGVHTGTHVDAPNHFIEGTKRVVDLDLATLIGPCTVVEVPSEVMAIDAGLASSFPDAERLLIKSRNSEFWSDLSQGFRKDFTYIEPDAAKVLVNRGVKLVGIDYLSVEAFDAESPDTHITLLEKEVIILEGLDLRQVEPGQYELVCLPMKFADGAGDGAPARTVLRSFE